MEIVGSLRTRDKLNDQLLNKARFFSFLEKTILYIVSGHFRQQMVSLTHTNLTGFFREVDKQKKNKVSETCPTRYEQLLQSSDN